jgi:hypothetical protein
MANEVVMSANGSPTILPPENWLRRESIMPILYFINEGECKDRSFINRVARYEGWKGDEKLGGGGSRQSSYACSC